MKKYLLLLFMLTLALLPMMASAEYAFCDGCHKAEGISPSPSQTSVSFLGDLRPGLAIVNTGPAYAKGQLFKPLVAVAPRVIASMRARPTIAGFVSASYASNDVRYDSGRLSFIQRE